MLKLQFRKIRAAIAITTLATSPLLATDFVVSNNADNGAGSLRQAILDANANSGGDVVFPSLTGTIHLASPLPTITANVNILGPGISLLTVSGNNQYVMFSAKSGTTNLFSNLTIADSYAQSYYVGQGIPMATFPGTAISNSGAMTMVNCALSNCVNSGLFGHEGTPGAIYNNGGTLTMQNCYFVGCGVPANRYNSGIRGGCIYTTGPLIMNNCTLTNCRATDAPAIYSQGAVMLNDCFFALLSNDDKEANSGAIVANGPSMTLNSCTISNCIGGWLGGIISGANIAATKTVFVGGSVLGYGGGLVIGGTNFFYGCTITRCVADGNDGGCGGGVVAGGKTTFVNCTVSQNGVDYSSGAGIYNSGIMDMTNCTISGNSCVGSGGNNMGGAGFLNFSNATLNLVSCTIASNTLSFGTGGGILNQAGGIVTASGTLFANNSSNDFTGVLTSGGYNLIRNITNCTFAGDLTGNITNANPLLGPLQNNGGVTATHALLVGSPAIDAGLATGGPSFDQRGVSRPQGAADDIGAFEYGAVPVPTLLAVAPSDNGCININFTGVPGRSYTILRASTPAGPWLPVVTSIPGSNACGSCLDINPPNFAFYRVVGQ